MDDIGRYLPQGSDEAATAWQRRILAGMTTAKPQLPNLSTRPVSTVALVQQLTAYLAALTLLVVAVCIYLLAGYLARGNHWWLMLAPIGFGIQQAGFRYAFTTWRKAHR